MKRSYWFDHTIDSMKYVDREKNPWLPQAMFFSIDEYKLLYMRILKNASTSIIKTFEKSWGDSLNYQDTIIREKLINGYKTFTIIRDPFQRFLAMYFDFENCDKEGGGNPNPKANLTYLKMEKGSTERFEAFIYDIQINGFFNAHLNPQVWFMNKIKFDILLRLENIDEQYRLLSSQNGIREPLKNLKRDKEIPTISDYIKSNNKVKDDIKELYKDDYKMYENTKCLGEK